MNSLELIALKDFPDVEPGNNIVELIVNNLNTNNILIDDFDVIVIAQKVISKAENRYIDLDNINISDQANNTLPGPHSINCVAPSLRMA